MRDLANIHRAAQLKLRGKAVTCLLLIILADFLFYEHRLGWTGALFALGVILALVGHNARVFDAPGARLIVPLSFGLIGALIESPARLPITFLVLSIAYLGAARNQERLTNGLGGLKLALSFVLLAFFRIFSDVGIARRYGQRYPDRD